MELVVIVRYVFFLVFYVKILLSTNMLLAMVNHVLLFTSSDG